jgi:tRNA(Phe) wybutosine-synthesizing methylase Tyw3
MTSTEWEKAVAKAPAHSAWMKAKSALNHVNAMLREAKQLHTLTEDEASSKVLAALQRVKERYAKDQQKACEENIKFASKGIPADLKAMGEKIAALISERLVDPATMTQFHWVAPSMWSGRDLDFSYVFRIKDGETDKLGFEVTFGFNGQLQVTSLLGSPPRDADFAEFVSKRVFEMLKGWSGLKGESDRNEERTKLLDKVGPILLEACKRLSEGGVDPLERDAMYVSCGFRRSRLESLSERDRDDTIVSTYRETTEYLKKALGALSDKVANISCEYGEKGWYTVTVTVK